MKIQIKRATLKELELLMEWRMKVLKDVFSLHMDEPLTELEQENRAYYMNALPRDEHIACFACADNKIIGCGGVCFYQEMPSPDNPSGKCAYLMNIYTQPAFRQNGVGRIIVEWLVGQAEERNITKIYLETSKQGHSLYRNMGFEDMPDYMKLTKGK